MKSIYKDSDKIEVTNQHLNNENMAQKILRLEYKFFSEYEQIKSIQ